MWIKANQSCLHGFWTHSDRSPYTFTTLSDYFTHKHILPNCPYPFANCFAAIMTPCSLSQWSWHAQENMQAFVVVSFTSEWKKDWVYLVLSFMYLMDPGGRVSRDRVLLTAMVILHGWVGSLRSKAPISASKGRWPPLCSVTFTPFTHCKPN